MPSICRDKYVDESISESGDLLYEEMAYNQHYKRGTRLIDFTTTDIDIGLYFACCEKFNNDAVIFIWSYSPDDSRWIRTKIQCELVNVEKKRLSISEYAEILFRKYPELEDKYSYKEDFYVELASYLDHGFMILQPCNPHKDNLRIQRQKGCMYVV